MAARDVMPAARSSHRRDGRPDDRRQVLAATVIGMLVASAACVAVAPRLMPASYSWTEHAVSESAAQGVDDAWLARLGFLLLGLAVLLLTSIARARWGAWGSALFRVYGVAIIAAAAFSHAPWEDVPYDELEDFLHSVAASAVGFTFTVGVLVVSLRRSSHQAAVRAFDWIAIGAAVGLSVVMFNATGIAGLVQRVIFAIGFVWFGLEAARSARSDEARTGEREQAA